VIGGFQFSLSQLPMQIFPLADGAQQPFGTELPPRCVGKPGRRGLFSGGSADSASEFSVE
jgi:hypothetical protein